MTTAPNEHALANLLAPIPLVVSAAEVQSWLMAEINLPRLTGMQSSTREVGTKLYALWLKVEDQQITAGEALAEFQAWVEGASELMDAYASTRVAMFKKLAASDDTRARQISRARSKAMAEAFAETRRHPQGPDQHTGKTVACFVLVSAPARSYWIGHSGFGHHQQQSHLRMTALLAGVHKVEEWEVDVCAEVDCMKQALTAGAAEDDLVWYCFTWNAPKARWTGRSACLNCRQWLSRLVLRTE
jgi:hypothetical protein